MNDRLAGDAQRPTTGRAGTLTLILAVLAVRIIYLAWLSPWELAGDEAYYWEWSRRLGLCYYEKGPGLAWMIAPCTYLFGSSEWAVRLPAAISLAFAAWLLAELVRSVGGTLRASRAAVVLFLLIPAFVANAQICTQDAPIIAIWIALTWLGLRFIRHWHSGAPSPGDWLAIAAVLGIGFLVKQSILLFVPSFVIYAAVQRRQLRWRPKMAVHALGALVLFLATLSPMIVWNIQHHWPTMAHTLGHLGAGGDQHGSHHYTPRWMLDLLGSQFAAIGPGAFVLMAIAVGWAIRSRRTEPERWPARLWMLCAALPSLAFFFLLSASKSVIGSWPFPSYTPLLVLVGEMAATELPGFRERVRQWQAMPSPRPKLGFVRRRPETPFKSMWDLAIGYGVVAALVIAFPNMLAHIPVVGPKLASPLSRITGHRAAARQAQAVLTRMTAETGRPPTLVTRHYMTAALYAFYLEDHPAVCTAAAQMGGRPTAYDFWPETNLGAKGLRGHALLLDGVRGDPWASILRFGRLRAIDDGRWWLGVDYQGPGAAGVPNQIR